MKATLAVAALAAVMLWSLPAPAQQKADCPPQPSASPGTEAKAKPPQEITGEVTKIDQQAGMVTLRDSAGQTHEFRASKETIQDMKVGDRIEAKLRAGAPGC